MGTVRQFPALVILPPSPSSCMATAALMLVPAALCGRSSRTGGSRGPSSTTGSSSWRSSPSSSGSRTMNRQSAAGRALPAPHAPARSIVVLPIPLALPLVASRPRRRAVCGAAYFEMLSSLTTTGATVFDRHWTDASRPSSSLARARRLGGWPDHPGRSLRRARAAQPRRVRDHPTPTKATDLGRRTATARPGRGKRTHPALHCGSSPRSTAGFTGLLALLLDASPATGPSSRSAMPWRRCRRAASRRSAAIGLGGHRAGVGEAADRSSSCSRPSRHKGPYLSFARARFEGPNLHDPQVQLMLISVLGVTLLLFLRAFAGAVEADRQTNLTRRRPGDLGQPLHRALLPHHHRLREPVLADHADLVAARGPRHHPPRRRLRWAAASPPRPAASSSCASTRSTGTGCARWTGWCIPARTPGRRGSGEGMISERGTRIAFVFLMLFLVSARADDDRAGPRPASRSSTASTLAVAALTTTGPAIGHPRRRHHLFASSRRWRAGSSASPWSSGGWRRWSLIALLNPAYWRSMSVSVTLLHRGPEKTRRGLEMLRADTILICKNNTGAGTRLHVDTTTSG
jgi:trk system potassium uptake protein